MSVKTLACPACGASLTVRAPGQSLAVVCSACGSVLDARDPDFKVIERHAQKTKMEPRIPLGSRGRLRGEMFEVIGFLVRQARAEGVPYSWHEYLLFNPYQGFRWLSEYQGHWILVKAATGHPKKRSGDGRAAVSYLGATFDHFQTAEAEVAYVVGEFPWRVHVGEKAVVEDYIDPPRILSCEQTADETTWSIGEYIEGDGVWKAFNLKGAPPNPQGVGVVQPSPFAAHTRNVVRLLAVFIGAALAIHVLFSLVSQNRIVFENKFVYEKGKGETTLVTEVFELTGRRSNVRIDIDTDLSNNWGSFNLALINEGTGSALNFGREVSYYFGREGGESWSEGGRADTVYLPAVGSGRYYLLIEPESSAARLTYMIRVRRDAPRIGYTLWATAIVTLPALLFWYRRRRFEYKRWLESDHPMAPLLKPESSSDDD
jgi:hypothetical protein